MSDPTVDAAREILSEALDELRAAVVGLDRDSLNRPPLPQEANSLAVLVVHALASTRAWLSLATGAPPPPRDRDEEFRTVVSDPSAFLQEFDAQTDACLALLGPDTAFDPQLVSPPAPWRRGALAQEPVTAAWALLHGLVHLNEHVGHAQLTRQLWTA